MINVDEGQDPYSGGNVFARFIDYSNTNPQTSINLNRSTLYPDLHFTYNITDKKSIQFGMSKRIERPSGAGHHWGQLRPFPRSVYINFKLL